MPPIPVLAYHSVDDDPPGWLAPYTVAPRAFAAQLDALVAAGRAPVTAGQVAAARRGGPHLPEHAVAVTFDDGYLDFLTSALPELTVRSIPATLFVTTGALGPRNRSRLPDASMLSLGQVAELDADGVEIGAHSHLHPQLDTLDAACLDRELSVPRQILEQTLGHQVDLYAYPHGYSSPAVRARTRRAGYRAAFGVRNAFSPDPDDPFRIARLTVRADTTPARFHAWLHGTGAPVAGPRDQARTIAWRIYRRQRASLSQRHLPESR